jgi:hypothetical protein
MGEPGYSYGMIDDEPYSIGVNAAGARVMTGVTPDWFDVDMADTMSKTSQGLDPETGDALSGFGKGRGGYNARGDFIDQYGNASHFGDWSDLEALADERDMSTKQVEEAFDTTRNTDRDLEHALDIISDRDEFGLGDDYGTATNPDVATVEGVAGVTMNSDEFGMDTTGTGKPDDYEVTYGGDDTATSGPGTSDDTTGGSSGTGSDTATGPADTGMDFDEDYGWSEEADDSPDSESNEDDTCVIASHAISTGSFSNLDRARAIVYCKRKYHGKWYGEMFRKGYQHLGKKAIERGDAADHYDEFKDFVAVGRGHKSDLKTRLNFYRRTAQFFLTGLGLTIKEKINANH